MPTKWRTAYKTFYINNKQAVDQYKLDNLIKRNMIKYKNKQYNPRKIDLIHACVQGNALPKKRIF